MPFLIWLPLIIFQVLFVPDTPGFLKQREDEQ